MNIRVKKYCRILGVIIGFLFVIIFIGHNCLKVQDSSFETSSATEIITTLETTTTSTTTTTETQTEIETTTQLMTTTTSEITSAAEASSALMEVETETVEESTQTSEETTTTEETIIEEVVEETITEEVVEETTTETEVIEEPSLTFVKDFSRGTYYAYGGARKGGSGRQLIDCSQGKDGIKGSIASSYLYKKYGYNYNGSRTKVYLEISGYSSMNGWYYLDDSDAGNPNVIDFFYLTGSNCPFRNQGVVKVKCYI